MEATPMVQEFFAGDGRLVRHAYKRGAIKGPMTFCGQEVNGSRWQLDATAESFGYIVKHDLAYCYACKVAVERARTVARKAF